MTPATGLVFLRRQSPEGLPSPGRAPGWPEEAPTFFHDAPFSPGPEGFSIGLIWGASRAARGVIGPADGGFLPPRSPYTAHRGGRKGRLPQPNPAAPAHPTSRDHNDPRPAGFLFLRGDAPLGGRRLPSSRVARLAGVLWPRRSIRHLRPRLQSWDGIFGSRDTP